MNDSYRVAKLKRDMLAEERWVDTEQARIIDRVHRETQGEAPAVVRAKALRAALQEVRIRIEDGELIVGNRTPGVRSGVVFPECGLLWMEEEVDGLAGRAQDPFHIREEDARYVKEHLIPAWRERTLEKKVYDKIGSINDAISPVVKINQQGRAQGHIIPGIPKWLEAGPAGLRMEALSRRETARDADQKYYYESVAIAMEGVSCFMKRYALLAEERAEQGGAYAQDYGEVACICAKLAEEPPSSFHEALQSIWFLFVCLEMESNAQSFSLGRLDQYLLPYYRKDMACGLLDHARALELVECFFLKFNQIVCMLSGLESRYFAGFPIGFNLVVGGRDENGNLLENELSFLMLEAQQELHLPQPNLSARLCAQSSDRFIAACTDALAQGGGIPQIFNDESIIPALEKTGMSRKDAADYGIVGCVELAGCGNMLGWSNAAMFNVVKVLELALNHGVCLITGKKLAPDAGGLDTYRTYEELEAALEKQISYFIEKMVLCHNATDSTHGEMLPSPLLSGVVEGCVDSGTDVTQGGAKYNSSGIQFVQVANLIDSLAVLKNLVFGGKLSRKRLLEQLRNDYADEAVRRMVVEEVGKYGNDLAGIDYIAEKWIAFFDRELHRYQNVRGGNFHVGLYTVSSHVPMGANVGASCDGRRAGTPLADGGISPSAGYDRLGPTAVLKSASALDYSILSNGTLLNMKFSASMFDGEGARARFYALLRSFVRLGIHHVQFNVVSREELLNAQKDPEKYRNMLIRVAGYTAYFVELDEGLQNEIIRRTECVL